MNITVQTRILSNQVTSLKSRASFYRNKKSVFLSNSSTSCISSILSDIRENYKAISDNITELANYIESYVKDIEAFENKMSDSMGGYISDSSVSSIASKFSCSLKKSPINYDKIFQNVELSTFENSSLTNEINLDLSKFHLTPETMQMLLLTVDKKTSFTKDEADFLTAYYQNYYNLALQQQGMKVTEAQSELSKLENVEKNLKQLGYTDFAALERDYRNATTDEEKQRLQKLIDKTGFSSSKEFLNALKDAQEKVNVEIGNKLSIDQALKTVAYSFGLKSKEYQNFKDKTHIDDTNLTKLIKYDSASSMKTISFSDYCNKYGKVDPFTFKEAVEKKFGTGVSIVGIRDTVYDDLLKIKDLEPDVINYYKYTYQEYGEEAAKSFLTDMESNINMRVGEVQAKKFLDSLKNLKDSNSRIQAVGNHLSVSMQGLGTGITGFGANIKYAYEGLFTNKENRVYSSTEYESMYILQAISSNQSKLENGLISKDAKGNLISSSALIDYTADYGKLLDHNFQISQSIGNMVPSIALSALVPAIGQTSFGASAAGGSFHSAMVEGYDKSSSLKYGLVSGASELLTEKVLGGIPLLSDVQVTSFKTLLRSALKEGNEEFVQSYIDAVASKAILKKTINTEELSQEAIQSAIYGAITGGIMNISSFAINSSNIKTIQNQIKSGNVTESQFVDAMHELLPETKNMNYKEIIEEYSSPSKNVVLELSTLNGKNLSSSGSTSKLAGLGLFGLGSKIFNNGKLEGQLESLNSQREALLSSNEKLAQVNEQANKGLAFEISDDIADSYMELRNLDLKIRNLSETNTNTNTNLNTKLIERAKSLNSFVKKGVQQVTRVGKIGAGFSLLSTSMVINPVLGAVSFVPCLSLICDGVYGNVIKNSFLINMEGRKIETKEGKKKASLLYQDVFAFKDIIKSRFVDNKQNYFLARSVNALQYLEPNKSYGTVSQAFTLALLKKAKKMGFIKNLSFMKSDVKTNLTLERILLGVDHRDKKPQMYNLYFETTDKVFSKNDIDILLKGIDLSEFSIKTDKAGRILFDVDVSYEDVKAKLASAVSNLNTSSFLNLANGVKNTMADFYEYATSLIPKMSSSSKQVQSDEFHTKQANIDMAEVTQIEKPKTKYENAKQIESYFDQFPTEGRYGCNQDLPRIMVERDVPRVKELVKIVQSQISDITYDDAVKLISNLNDSSGICDYASIVNTIINMFKDKPDVFERHTGYSLTYVNDYGLTLPSDDLILLDLICFINKETLTDDSNNYRLTSSNKQYLLTNNDETQGIISKWLKSKNFDLNMQREAIYNNYGVLPWQKGLDIPLNELNNYLIQNIENALEHDSVILEVDPSRQQTQAKVLYLYDAEGQFHVLDGKHSMTVLGIQDDTHLIVDSWGKKCIVDINELREKNMYFALNIIRYIEDSSNKSTDASYNSNSEVDPSIVKFNDFCNDVDSEWITVSLNEEQTAYSISKSFLKDLIMDETVYQKFMNFKDNTSFFSENYEFSFDQVVGIQALTYFVEQYMQEGGIFSKEMKDRFEFIQSLYDKNLSSALNQENIYVEEGNQKYNFLVSDIQKYLETVSYSEIFNKFNLFSYYQNVPIIKAIASLSQKIKHSEILVDTYLLEKINYFDHLEQASTRINLDGVKQNEINFQNFEQEILGTLDPSFDPLSKIRKLYVELNKRMHYDMNYLGGTDDVRNDIYNKEVNIHSLNSNRIICKGWSEAFRQLLIDAGFNEEAVQIVGSDEHLGHKWVEIDLGEYIVIADATENIHHSTDLANCKVGAETVGLMYAPKSFSGIRLSQYVKNNSENIHKIQRQWNNIDEKIGYRQNSFNFFDLKSKIDSLFSNSTVYQKVIQNQSKESLFQKFLSMKIPDNTDGFEYYKYLKNMIYNQYGSLSQDVNVSIMLNALPSSQFEGITLVQPSASSELSTYMIYSESLGKVIFDNEADYQDFVRLLKLKGLK